jgi:alpha-tubulin suppressor-like RCC1 family protein
MGMKGPRSSTLLVIMVALMVLAACGQDTSTGPEEPTEENTPLRGLSTPIGCTVKVASGVLACAQPRAPASGPVPQFHIVGGQGVYVQLASSNVSYDAGSEVFQADVTVQNLLADPLGTPDGSTPTGIRVFFHTLPVVTAGTGSASVSNADGSGTFTGSAQPYFEYDEMLASGETSAAKTWQWSVQPTVDEFSFSVYVHADLSTGGGLYSRLALGDVQTCAILTPGDVWCWGENGDGVFGNGTEVPSAVPVPGAVGLRLRSLSLAIYGNDWACGVSLPGDMYCWGSNNDGVLGPGAGAFETTPQLVAGGMGFAMVEAGSQHACGLTTTGNAYCWGDNLWGNLGDGTWIDRTTPTAVLTSLTFSDIQAGEGFTCGLEASGNIYCWGSNSSGELGDGTTTPRLVPDSVSGNMRFVSVSVGRDHACAVATDGTPYCWGGNGTGELGVGDLNSRYVPTLVSGGLTVQWLSTGFRTTCAVDQAGAGWCWGEGEDGQLGTGNFNSTTVPTAMAGGLQWKTITPEEEHSCGVTIANEIYCWGSIAPFRVVGDVAMQTIDAGAEHSCGVAGSAAYCWGSNAAGQLGDGTTEDRYQPTPVTGAHAFRSVSASPWAFGMVDDLFHTCAVTTGDAAYCWGSNEFGELGNGTTTDATAPAQVSGSLSFRSVSAGRDHTCGVTTSDVAYCWGNDDSGQLGNGSTTSSTVPVAVTGSISFQSVTAGHQTCGVSTSGTGYCWGPDLFSSGPFESAPVSVAPTLTFQSISAGYQNHNCMVTTNNDAYCWGRNDSGQLGNGSTNIVPPLVSGGLSFASVSAGLSHTCGLTTGGVAYCWGDAQAAGTGSASGSLLVPTAVQGGLTFDVISAGDGYTCGVTTSDVVYCWGYDGSGAVGDGLGNNRLTPTPVVFP